MGCACKNKIDKTIKLVDVLHNRVYHEKKGWKYYGIVILDEMIEVFKRLLTFVVVIITFPFIFVGVMCYYAIKGFDKEIVLDTNKIFGFLMFDGKKLQN